MAADIRKEFRGSETAVVLCNATNTQMLKAALGGQLQQNLYGMPRDFMARAAPSVAKAYGDMISIPYNRPC